MCTLARHIVGRFVKVAGERPDVSDRCPRHQGLRAAQLHQLERFQEDRYCTCLIAIADCCYELKLHDEPIFR